RTRSRSFSSFRRQRPAPRLQPASRRTANENSAAVLPSRTRHRAPRRPIALLVNAWLYFAHSVTRISANNARPARDLRPMSVLLHSRSRKSRLDFLLPPTPVARRPFLAEPRSPIAPRSH